MLTSADNAQIRANIGLSNVQNIDITTWAGSSAITTLGTIGTGTWQGAIIGAAYGGAGATNGILKANGSGLVSAAVSGTDYEVPIGFSTGLTRSGNTVTVNSTQVITRLSNLTSNGFVTTTGANGTLSIVSSVNLSTQVTGNLSISNLNSGTGASASSFWAGDGTWKVVDKTTVGLSNVDNFSSTYLLSRANHTGTQLLATISDAGTAAALNVPASGDATAGQVVKGNDSRLTDARTPSNGSVTTAKFSGSTLVTAAATIAANNNDTTVPTSAAVKAYADAAASAVSGLRNKVTFPANTAASGNNGDYAVDGPNAQLAIYVTGTGWIFIQGFQI